MGMGPGVRRLLVRRGKTGRKNRLRFQGLEGNKGMEMTWKLLQGFGFRVYGMEKKMKFTMGLRFQGLGNGKENGSY